MTLLSIRRPLLRAGAALAGTAVLAAMTVAAGSVAASADTTVSVTYPVSGSTFVATPRFTLALGPGTLGATVDLNTGTLSANLSLPNATGSFKDLNLVPVTATAQFINNGPTTGTVDPSTGAIKTTSSITMRLVALSVAGIPVPVGPRCQTIVPASVTVASQPGFSIVNGGTLSGSYTIPFFVGCGLATPLINLTLPGVGNTISLTLGKAQSGS